MNKITSQTKYQSTNDHYGPLSHVTELQPDLQPVVATENLPQLSSPRAHSSHAEHSAPTAVIETNSQASTDQHTPRTWFTTCTADIQQFYSSSPPTVSTSPVCNYYWADLTSCDNTCGRPGINSGHLSSIEPIWSIRAHHYVAMSVTLASIFHVKLS